MLAGEEDVKAQRQLENLLQEFEKETFQKKLSRREDEPQIELNFGQYDYNVLFDGACSRTKASTPLRGYGFVVVSSDRQVVHEESGKVQTHERVTNNLAESYSIHKALTYLGTLDLDKFTKVQILGDSELVIK